MNRFRARAVLLDHDGTIVDSEGVHLQIWNDILSVYGQRLSQSFWIESCSGIPTPDTAAALVEKFALPLSAAELARKKLEATAIHLQTAAFPLVSGVYDLLGQLHETDVQLGVVSGADRAGVEASLERHGLRRFLNFVVGGDDVLRSKPAPDVYLKALDILGLPAQDCIAVEDSEHGVQAAKAAGICCIALRTEYTATHDLTAADHILTSFAQLGELLQQV